MRQTEEILAEMDAAQQGFDVLATVDSVSEVSIWGQIKKMFALLVQMLESAQDVFKAEISSLIANAQVGTLSWYVAQAKLFQIGDTISVVSGRVTYDKFDAQKQIIAQAAITEESNGRLSLKVAKKESSGLVPLGSDEMEAFKSYVGKFKYAGVFVDAISMEADHVKLVVSVKVDRQVISNNGTLLADTSKFPVTDAISAYLAYLPSNSILNITALTDAIQQVKGVIDFTVTASYSRRPVSTTWNAFNREVLSQAGHMILHADSQISYTN